MEIESSPPARRNQPLAPQKSVRTGTPHSKHGENLNKIAQILKQLPAPQQLTATVTTDAKALTPAQQAKLKVEMQLYRVTLKAGGFEFPANSPVHLKKGQMLTLSMSAQNKLSIQTINTQNQDTLREALKNLTPRQEKLTSLLNSLQQIHQFIPTSPAHTNRQALQAQLKNAAAELFSNLPQLTELKQPRIMRQVIQQSGIFHENTLKQANRLPYPTKIPGTETNLKQQTNDHPHSLQGRAHTRSSSTHPANAKLSALPPDLKNLLKTFSNTLKEIERKNPSTKKKSLAETALSSKEPASKTKQKNTIETPSAGKLSTADAVIKTITSKTNSSTAPQQNPAGYNDPKNVAIPSPEILLKQKKIIKPKSLTEAGQANEKTTAALLKQVNASLARIQFNQVSTLSHQNNLSAETTTGNQWFFDLPINTGSGIEVVHIRIHDEEPEQNRENLSREKRWQVDLEFDLNELGHLHVELVLIGQVATSVLWVEHDQGFKKINRHIDQLKSNLEEIGLIVETLLCRTGKPTISKSQISSRLIDITT